MDRSDWIVGGVIALFIVTLFGGMIGSMLHESYRIAKAPDPLVMACALGKDKACIAVAARR